MPGRTAAEEKLGVEESVVGGLMCVTMILFSSSRLSRGELNPFLGMLAPSRRYPFLGSVETECCPHKWCNENLLCTCFVRCFVSVFVSAYW